MYLGVAAGRALDAQYKAHQIVERINAYFGYRAVSDMRIVQLSDLASAQPQSQAVTPARQPVRAVSAPVEVAAVADDGLRAALERMAAGIGSRKTRPSSAI